MARYLSGEQDHWTHQDPGVCGVPLLVDFFRGRAPALGYNGTYGGEVYAGEAMRVVKQHNASEPLFLYVAWQINHVPLQVGLAVGGEVIFTHSHTPLLVLYGESLKYEYTGAHEMILPPMATAGAGGVPRAICPSQGRAAADVRRHDSVRR